MTIRKGLSAGKVGFAAPAGPSMDVEAPLAEFGQPPGVRALRTVLSEPAGGMNVRLPRMPAGGAAGASPPVSIAIPVMTTTASTVDANRVKNLFFNTGQLASLQEVLTARGTLIGR